MLIVLSAIQHCQSAPLPLIEPIMMYEINDQNQAGEISLTINENSPEFHSGQDSNDQIIIFTDDQHFDGWGG